jgi:hypothetical protein
VKIIIKKERLIQNFLPEQDPIHLRPLLKPTFRRKSCKPNPRETSSPDGGKGVAAVATVAHP